jgi:hypothetical protein
MVTFGRPRELRLSPMHAQVDLDNLENQFLPGSGGGLGGPGLSPPPAV